MIDGAFLHFEGIGPGRLKKLQDAGVHSWFDAMAEPDKLPSAIRDTTIARIAENVEALERRDVSFFANHLAGPDRWRILSEFLEETSYFDIETFGLEHDSPITTIAVWHKGQIHSFVEHENLDEFLDLLEDVTLMASFNGASFDVPRVLDTFHIPSFPCPHIDLRWLSYHKRLFGGLKGIADRCGIVRPTDLATADGAEAITLWSRWIHFQDQSARQKLIRYCASDVILLVFLAKILAERPDFSTVGVWDQLPPIADKGNSSALDSPDNAEQSVGPKTLPFGEASPSKLRARRTG